MLEEVEEANFELSRIHELMDDMWDKIKNNVNPIECSAQIKDFAISLAAESTQIAAMAQKFIDLCLRIEEEQTK